MGSLGTLSLGEYAVNLSQTEKVKYTIEGHCDEVSDLIIAGPTLFSASYDCTIRQWSLQDKDLQALMAPDSAAVIQKVLEKAKEAKPMASLTEDEERELAELMSDNDE
jgi:WD40 repeat protein